MFGSHLSIAGGMVNALQEAERLKLDTVQVFTKNQRQWRITPLKDEDAQDWLDKLRDLGWEDRTVSHNSYLINLASPDDTLRDKSINLQREEIERCERLSIPYLVSHPGAHTGSGEEAGLERIAQAYAKLLKDTAGYRTAVCIENTVGSGSNLGGPFEHLAALRARIIELAGKEAERRIGFCFDTCHAHAAGHDMHTQRAAQKTLDEFDRVCGIENLLVVHLNDSVGDCASHRDRHAHIGEGTIGKAGFGPVVNHPRLRGVPKILETPKGESEKGTPLDTLNLRRLHRLVKGGKGASGPQRAPGRRPINAS